MGVAAAAALLALAVAAPGTASATITHTFAPSAPGGGNCYPFGIGVGGAAWTPTYGSIYKNLPAFKINPNDVLAFDLNGVGEANVQLQIEMAPTTSNGGNAPAGAFTTLVPNTQVPLNPRGNLVTGDFELQFRSQASFDFPGGGLIIRFSNPAGELAADSNCDGVFSGNLASSTDSSGLFVSRYYTDGDGLPPYNSSDPDDIPPFRLILTPPNSFTFGAAARNKKKGTARLPVTVPGPGVLTLSGNGVKAQTAAGGAEAGTAVSGAGTVELTVKATGKKKRKLKSKGKVKVSVQVTFTPTGGDPGTQSSQVKLKKSG